MKTFKRPTFQTFWHNYLIEPQRKETFLRTCAPSEGLDQPAHLRRLIKIFTGRISIGKDVNFLHADNKDSDQTAHMCRLIWVFVRRTYQKVRFLTLRFLLQINEFWITTCTEAYLKNSFVNYACTFTRTAKYVFFSTRISFQFTVLWGNWNCKNYFSAIIVTAPPEVDTQNWNNVVPTCFQWLYKRLS